MCWTWKHCWRRLVVFGFVFVAAFAFFTDWEMTSMSRLWEAHVAKLSALVPSNNTTGATPPPFIKALPVTTEMPQGPPVEHSVTAHQGDGPRIYKRGVECKKQALDLGILQTPEQCGAAVMTSPQCGALFMFSHDHPDWRCRCCALAETGRGAKAPWWDLYEVRRPRVVAPAAPAAAPLAAPVAAPAAAPVAAPKAAPVADPLPAPLPAPAPAPARAPAPAPAAPLPAKPVAASKPKLAPPPEPSGPPPGKYKEQYHARSVECAEQAYNFGNIPTIEKCDKLAAATPECGNYLMFSKSHPDWACRCCAPFGESDGPGSPNWDVYKRLFPRLKTIQALPTAPPPLDPFHGLPIADGPRPAWLKREDALVVDARAVSHGGILILQAVLTDVNSQWGAKRSATKARPDWLRAILATNRAHARKHGHALVLRAAPTQPQLTTWMVRDCGDKSTSYCLRQNERENFNWEKHLMMSDYLSSPQNFSHVLMLDADAALIQPQLDTLRRISAILETEHKDLFLTDEDWLDANGKGRINGGLMFAKNTNFTRNLFLDTFDAHVKGPALHRNWRIGVPVNQCTSNEQICLNDLWYGQNKKYFLPHAMMASGKQYNRGAERGGEAHITDPTTEIMHWMGGSKGSAGRALCKGVRDLTMEGKTGYGCKP